MPNFAYLRVSRSDSTTEQQLHQIREAGFEVEDDRVYVEHGVSGKLAALQRDAFQKLNERLHQTKDATLIVARIDRLGRDVLDVLSTIETLMKKGISIHVLGIGTLDSSPIGQLTRAVLLAISQFERDLISERTRAKLNLLREQGVKLGRPSKAADTEMRQKAQSLFEQGLSWRKTAKELGCALSTLQRLMAA